MFRLNTDEPERHSEVEHHHVASTSFEGSHERYFTVYALALRRLFRLFDLSGTSTWELFSESFSILIKNAPGKMAVLETDLFLVVKPQGH
ncbi:hypothetical protein NQ317_004117 [Molorchus minor]|uniref:Uncharacterized protein n=1 Tax=Molorchus minor TaxID=1323400 RepID=A0ABQ9J3P3_9CUCU|nr:hypothetical protein NQ317_004117 [Molorchus minor]